jgi:proteasome accessory factor A
VTRIVEEDEVLRAVTDPPEDTRAWFRGQAIRRFPRAVVAAGWDSLVIDVGERTLKRVPLLDPARGTRDLVGHLLDEATDPADLVRLLRG